MLFRSTQCVPVSPLDRFSHSSFAFRRGIGDARDRPDGLRGCLVPPFTRRCASGPQAREPAAEQGTATAVQGDGLWACEDGRQQRASLRSSFQAGTDAIRFTRRLCTLRLPRPSSAALTDRSLFRLRTMCGTPTYLAPGPSRSPSSRDSFANSKLPEQRSSSSTTDNPATATRSTPGPSASCSTRASRTPRLSMRARARRCRSEWRRGRWTLIRFARTE